MIDFRSSGTKEQFSQQQLFCQLALFDRSGKERWKFETGVTMRGFGRVQGDNAQQELRKEMTEGFAQLLSSDDLTKHRIPTYIFATLNEILAGESQLTQKGEAPPPPPPKANSGLELPRFNFP